MDDFNQTEVWNSFRVARRAKVKIIDENDSSLKACHDGYKRMGFIHTRLYKWKKNKVIINDFFNKSTNHKLVAFFHFHDSLVNYNC